jgi:hypothetical protein
MQRWEALTLMRAFLIAMGALVVVIAGAIIFVVLSREAPTFTDRSGGDSWRNLIFDFQTLITGVLAVLAAFFTVAMMDYTERKQAKRHTELVQRSQKADLLQGERHEQLMAISNRRDRLIIERAVDPQVDEGRQLLNLIRRLTREFELTNRDYIDAMRGNPRFYDEATKKIKDFIARKALAEAQPLFDGETNWIYEQLKNLAERICQLPTIEVPMNTGAGLTQDEFRALKAEREQIIDDNIIRNANARHAAFLEMEGKMAAFIDRVAELPQSSL